MQHGGTVWRLGHRPALDGIRALAVLAVIAHHAGLLPARDIGVDVFFALSGFLITSLLLEEHERSDRIRLPAFYTRRALRLLPALVTLVAFVVLFGFGVGLGPNWVTWSTAAAALFYYTNFALLAGEYSALTHTWSLAIEEQFYLTWPLVLLLLAPRGRRATMWVALTGAVASAVWSHIVLGTGSPEHYAYALDTRLAPILAGCALAAWMQGGSQRNISSAVVLAPLAALGALAVRPDLFAEWRAAAVAIAAATFTWAVARQDEIRLLELAPLRWVGIRSYGIYLWHVPVLVIAESLAPNLLPAWLFTSVLIVTLAFAAVSYAFVEEPFLRIKDRRSELPSDERRSSAPV